MQRKYLKHKDLGKKIKFKLVLICGDEESGV